MRDIDDLRTAIAVVLGVWLMAIPVAIPGVVALDSEFALWNYVLVGAGIAGLTGYSWLADRNAWPGGSVAATAVGVLGVWVIALPFYTTAPETGWLGWNDLVVGGIVAWMGFYNAYRISGFEVDLAPDRSDEPG